MSMKKPSNLLEPEQAVGSYLADMLSEPSVENPPAATLGGPGQLDNLFLLREALAEVPEIQTDEVQDDDQQAVNDENTIEQSAEGVAQQPVKPLDFPLQCLMFSVAEQQLSMPLIQMSGVVEPPEKISRLPGSADMILGVFQYRGSNVQVIDSAALLGIKRDRDRPPAKLIVLQGDQWAITADRLATVLSVDETDIKLSGSKRPSMMLGTIKASLAQLLSPQAITETLESGKDL